jgi:hypothetical protein
MEKDFDEIERELRAQAAGQLRASGAAWEFERAPGHHRRSADRGGHSHPRRAPG